ncbi:Wzz/FepE/Etk N-terminal domain-containing protein [Planococcus shenhongbingii]|uniref:YveK family protein n=1 Tax=Planococcus shenhongbingii TaxID=3058398 RepID=UPI0026271C91|nr:Wzz/FepE/Etk N-terminal domain-containing protein [Planococcus sp. N016]WKA57745.1 Wzz/FepE/Etk N-terminal domain-containing protein [Planococcus sp. N016]
MEEKITLEDLAKILKERSILIVSLTVLAIILAAILSYYILTPQYETSTQLLVNQEQTDVIRIDNQTIQTDLQLINTYSVIIKSPAILGKVIEQNGLNMSVDELNEKIIVESSEESQVFEIRVKDESLAKAVLIANSTAKVFQTEIQELMEINNVSILTAAIAKPGQKPIQPTPLLNMAIAGVIGLMLGVGIAFLLNYLDNTLKSEQDIKDYLNIPVIGTISTIVEKEKNPSTVPITLNRREA